MDERNTDLQSDVCPVQGNQKESTNSRKENLFLTYLHDIVFLVAGVLLVFSLCFRVVVVSGPSMNSTLIDGDWLLLTCNTLYSEPSYGDIIVASKDVYDDGKPIIKRVIATEGQTVDVDFLEGIVYVDGTALYEPYTNTPTTLPEGVSFPLVVDPGCVFVMGDNRNSSKDSRSPEIGLIDKREILGRAIFLMFPGTDGGKVKQNFDRVGVVS
ncbi:MAG: signal peptidase I [Oscillospiraceae bacterium]|nr:signal peptidase I [Oscillospiraceae bacterium]